MKIEDGQLDYNRNHPERKKGEIFLENLMRGRTTFVEMKTKDSQGREKTYPQRIHEDTGKWEDFNKIPFKTKRLGKIAFAPSSTKEKKIEIQTQRPVFAQLWELKEKGFDPNLLFKDFLNKNYSPHLKEHDYEHD